MGNIDDFAIYCNTGTSVGYSAQSWEAAAVQPLHVVSWQPFPGFPQVKHASVRVVMEDGRVFRYDISGPCQGGLEIDSPDPYHYPVVSDAGNPVILPLPHNSLAEAVFRFKRITGGSGTVLTVTEEQAELDFGDDGI